MDLFVISVAKLSTIHLQSHMLLAGFISLMHSWFGVSVKF